MTTIIYHRMQIGYDSRVTRGNIIHDDDYNKRITERGAEFFIAGSTSLARAMADAYHRGRFGDFDDSKDLIEAIIWHKKKLMLGCYDGNEIAIDEETLDKTFGIGTGGDLAVMAAKQGGLSAPDAVAAAMTMDTCTGGRIRTFNLKG